MFNEVRVFRFWKTFSKQLRSFLINLILRYFVHQKDRWRFYTARTTEEEVYWYIIYDFIQFIGEARDNAERTFSLIESPFLCENDDKQAGIILLKSRFNKEPGNVLLC